MDIEAVVVIMVNECQDIHHPNFFTKIDHINSSFAICAHDL